MPDATDHRGLARDPRVDAYLSALPADQRELLERVRGQIERVVPEATETISYGMPAYKVGKRFLVSFAGWKRHCSIYPLTDTFVADHREEIKGYGQTKGSLHFTPDRPLPAGIVEALVRARLTDLERGLG
jgi:uncharacterized protein YdhG (YjbR/CyaY superfamily)